MKATAIAHSNIALVKYWGKRDYSLNLPAVGSVSVTLNKLYSKTRVQFSPDLRADVLMLNGKRASFTQEKRIQIFMDTCRDYNGVSCFANVESQNNFLTGAGLASSASAFASLALAASVASNNNLNATELSILARRGSGSAARSIYGGFVEMKVGSSADGMDSYAVQLADENYWDLHVLIVVTSNKEKPIGSTEAMKISSETAPYYQNWVDSSHADIWVIKKAISDRNFEKLGTISEHSALKMHALMLSSLPPSFYWNASTIRVIKHVYDLRKKGIEAYFTIDAGPQVKILCQPSDAFRLKTEFSDIKGVKSVIDSSIGPSAYVIDE